MNRGNKVPALFIFKKNEWYVVLNRFSFIHWLINKRYFLPFLGDGVVVQLSTSCDVLIYYYIKRTLNNNESANSSTWWRKERRRLTGQHRETKKTKKWPRFLSRQRQHSIRLRSLLVIIRVNYLSGILSLNNRLVIVLLKERWFSPKKAKLF